MVSSLGHGILPGLNDIMEPLLDLASKPRALKVGTWNISSNCSGDFLRKENGCLLRWGGVRIRERMNVLSIGEDESKMMCFIGVHPLIFSCVTCDHLPGETSRELWVESGPGRWLSLEIEESVNMCKVAVGTWLLGTMDIRDVVFFHVSSAWVLLILHFQDGQVLHSLAALCRSVGGMLSPFLGKFLEANQLWKNACSLSLICIQFMWWLSTCNTSWLSKNV